MNMQLSVSIMQLKRAVKNSGLTYEELSAKANIPVGTLKNIFCGKTKNPRIDTIRAIENALGLSLSADADKIKFPVYHADSSLKFNLDEVELQDYYPVPLLGRVVAGVPIEAQENLEGYIYVSFRPSEEYFALRVHGDSMKNVGINDKAIIVCHKQETAESGEIVVAMLNGEQTVKRYKLHSGAVFLMPENSDYLPIPVTPADDFLILGKVVEIRITV